MTSRPTDGIDGFRRDIEGLRGVAILMVVLGHARVPGFGGGFTGVDVFFVISGFLITGLLVRELRETSRVDFWAFYARRARRLLPAFAVMMLCTWIALFWTAPGADMPMQKWSGLWAALWASNIYFSFANFGYFESSALDSLFLHTWSLGVEEQFYLVWPALLAAVWAASRRNANALFAIVVAVAVSGLLVSIAATRLWPVAAYYLMPFRLWELAVGGCCVFLSSVPSLRAVRGSGGILGVVLLAATCGGLSENTAYPGAWAMLPVLGAALLVIGGNRFVSVCLASAPLTLVGRISYSWYLWHWPMLALAHRLGRDDPAAVAVAVVGSLAVALASYLVVERTTRYRAITDARQAVVAGLLGSALVALLPSLGLTVARLRAPQFATTEDRVRAMTSMPLIYSIHGCDEWYLSDRLVPCMLESGEGRPQAVVLGDSLGLHWFPALHRALTDAGWNVVVLTKSSCPMVDESFFYERIHRRFTECEAWRNAVVDYIGRTGPGIVVVGSAGSYPFTTDQWIAGSRRFLEALHGGAAKVVVLAPSPRLPFDGPSCVIRHFEALQGGAGDLCTAPLVQIEDRGVIDALTKSIEGLRGTAIVNLNDIACPRGICSAWVAGELAYRDAQHLNASYVLGLATPVGARLAPYLQSRTAASAL
jgi:peptidoglycan/LPS O-acetylase OafA/YrhL